MDHEGATYKTLRDEIAMLVLQSLLRVPKDYFDNPTMPQVCNVAYMWADSMLAARDK
jgi:hypothetical protein